MQSLQFDLDAHVGKPIHLQKGRVNDLALKVVRPRVGIRRYTHKLSKALDGKRLNASLPIPVNSSSRAVQESWFVTMIRVC